MNIEYQSHGTVLKMYIPQEMLVSCGDRMIVALTMDGVSQAEHAIHVHFMTQPEGLEWAEKHAMEVVSSKGLEVGGAETELTQADIDAEDGLQHYNAQMEQDCRMD